VRESSKHQPGKYKTLLISANNYKTKNKKKIKK
jgi:hypothetical protein